VRRIEASDLAAFHQARYGPATSCLVLAGSFDGDEAEDLLGSFELPPSSPGEARLPLQLTPAAPATGIRMVDIPKALQTELRVGHIGVARDSRDLPALQVLNTVLGDGPTSRLAESLRQRLGLTYHVRSRFAVHRHGGTFVVSAGVATEKARAALEGVMWEIERLREELVPEVELEIAKGRLLGIQLRRFQSILGTGGTLSHMALDGDPLHYLERRRREIGAVEPEALRELARRHLQPGRLVAVAVGPAGTLQTQFSDGGVWMPTVVAELTS
jgi:zinc protease